MNKRMPVFRQQKGTTTGEMSWEDKMGKQQEEKNEETEKEEIFQVIKLTGRLFLKQNKQENMNIYISK